METTDPSLAMQRRLSQTYKSLDVQASSVLTFTMEWKELEDHFESTRTELDTRLEDLERRVKLVALLEANAEKKKEEMEDRAEKLGEMEAAIEQRRREVEEGKRELDSIKALIDVNNEELKIREGEFIRVEKLIEEKTRELRVKESEYFDVEKQVKERSRKLSWVEERVGVKSREVESKERKVEEALSVVDAVTSLIEEKKRELEECESELVSKKERLRLTEKSVENCDRLLELKEKLISVLDLKARDFSVVKKSMEEWSRKLEVKEGELERLVGNVLGKVQLKESQIDSVEKSLQEREKEWSCLLQVKEKELEEWAVKLESITKQADKKVEEGSEIIKDGRGLQEFMDEHFRRTDSMSTKLAAIFKDSSDPAKLVLDAMQGFYPDDSELNCGLSVRRRSCCLLLEKLKKNSPLINSQVREEAAKLAANWKAKMQSENDLEVLGFLSLVAAYDLNSIYDPEELKRLISRVSNGQLAAPQNLALAIASPASIVADSLQNSLDPSKLLLDWMQTSFSQYWTRVDVGFEATATEILMSVFKQLLSVLPQVGPHVKEDAMKLAVQWKAKINADSKNALEIFGFLLFIATYGLLDVVNVDEIMKLLGIISQHKEALQLCHTLGFADNIPEFIHIIVERKQLMKAIELICTFNLIGKFPPRPLVKQLVREKMISCEKAYKEMKLLNEKVKVVDQYINDLRAVIKFIKDSNLESEYPSSNIERKITELEIAKENWRLLPSKNFDNEQKRGTKLTSITPPSKNLDKEQKKRTKDTSITPLSENLDNEQKRGTKGTNTTPQSKNLDNEQKRGTKRTSITPPTRSEPQQKLSRTPGRASIAQRPILVHSYTPWLQQPSSSSAIFSPRQFGAFQYAGVLPSPSYRPRQLYNLHNLADYGNNVPQQLAGYEGYEVYDPQRVWRPVQ